MPKKPEKPVECPECGQMGNKKPGFKVLEYPEAIGFADDGMTPVDSFQCNNCGYVLVVEKGLIRVTRNYQ